MAIYPLNPSEYGYEYIDGEFYFIENLPETVIVPREDENEQSSNDITTNQTESSNDQTDEDQKTSIWRKTSTYMYGGLAILIGYIVYVSLRKK